MTVRSRTKTDVIGIEVIIYSSSSAIAAAFKALDRRPNGLGRAIAARKGNL
jgi:hypothetical protein